MCLLCSQSWTVIWLWRVSAQLFCYWLFTSGEALWCRKDRVWYFKDGWTTGYKTTDYENKSSKSVFKWLTWCMVYLIEVFSCRCLKILKKVLKMEVTLTCEWITCPQCHLDFVMADTVEGHRSSWWAMYEKTLSLLHSFKGTHRLE